MPSALSLLPDIDVIGFARFAPGCSEEAFRRLGVGDVEVEVRVFSTGASRRSSGAGGSVDKGSR